MAVRGFLDVASDDYVGGWAWDDARPAEAVALQVLVDGVPVARTVADQPREDLVQEGIGDGRHSFRVDAASLELPPGGCVIAVRVEASGEDLTHSPAWLERSAVFDETARHALSAKLASPASDEVLLERAQFLAREVDQLLGRVAWRPTGRSARRAARNRPWRWREGGEPVAAVQIPRALVIDRTLPDPSRDAGSQAVLSHLHSLQRLGYDVTFVPADMAQEATSDPLAASGIAIARAPWIGSVEEVLRRQPGAWDLVCLHRVEMASRYLPLVRHYAPHAKVVFSLAALQSLLLFRQAGIEDRPELVPQGNHVRTQEMAAAAASHAVLTHSAAEAALLQLWLPQGNCHVVPWAVPVRPGPARFDARGGVLFAAHFGHEPNLDAVTWLLDEIMPLVWALDPAIRCLVAGSAMPEALARGRDARIELLGAVEDLDALLNRVRLTVAPMAYGAGLQGKVGASLAAGVPCVCTPVAAEGYALPAPLQQAVAADAAAIAASIVRLHNSADAFAACREAGLAYMARMFSEAEVDAAMRRAMGLPAAAQGAPAEMEAERLGHEQPVSAGALTGVVIAADRHTVSV